ASAASLVLPASPAQAQSTLSLAWEHHHPGNRYHLSSPTLGDVDGDGIDDIAIGGLDGWVRVYRADGSTIWERPAIVRGSSTPTAVDSSPTIADLDGDGANEVIVGAVSNWVPNQHGGLVVFDRHGNIRWNWAGQDIFHMWNAAAG